MGKLKDKYNNWKATRVSKYRVNNRSSFLETKKDAQEIVDVLNNETKLNKFAYEFKQPWHKKALIISKKFYFWSFFSYILIAIFFIITYGLLKLTTLSSPSSVERELSDINWKSLFIPITIICGLFILFAIPKFIIMLSRNKKYSNSEIYNLTFTENPIILVIVLLFLLSLFISFKPNISFAPVTLLSFLQNNNSLGKFLLLFIFIIWILTVINYVILVVSTIFCYSTTPKFNIELLKTNNQNE